MRLKGTEREGVLYFIDQLTKGSIGMEFGDMFERFKEYKDRDSSCG